MQYRRLIDGDDVGYLAAKLLEQHPYFPAGEIGPETEVCSAGPEPDVRVGIPGYVEKPRIIEFGLVTVAGVVPH